MDKNINLAIIFAILLLIVTVKLYIEGTGKSTNWLSYLFSWDGNNNKASMSIENLIDLHNDTSRKINEAAEAGYIEAFSSLTADSEAQTPPSNLHTIQDNIIDSVLIKTDSMKLMLFYKAGCPYCENFLPTWYKIINNLPNNVAYEEIEVESGEASRKKASQFKITQVPTVILLVNNVEKSFDGNRSYENIRRFLKNNGINLVERTFDSFTDMTTTAEEALAPTQPKNKNCPEVTFDKTADIEKDEFYFQIFNADGQYGYAMGGNKPDKVMNPFNAAYATVDSYLSSLPDPADPSKNSLKNASECANVYAKEIRAFGLCNKDELDKILKYKTMVKSGSAKLRIDGTDYSSNDAVVKAIKSACQL